MIRLTKKYFNLALVIGALNFDAYASNAQLKDINNIPDEVIRTNILSIRDVYLPQDYSNISQVSQKFNIMLSAVNFDIKTSTLKKMIEILSSGIGISINLSQDMEFNRHFNFTKLAITSTFNPYTSVHHLCNFPTFKNNQLVVNLLASYPKSEEISTKVGNDSIILGPSVRLMASSDSLNGCDGKLYVFVNKNSFKINEVENIWPFDKITGVSYTRYKTPSFELEENNNALKELIDNYHQNFPWDNQPLCASKILPEAFQRINYIISGEKENAPLTITYSFVVKKMHSQELVDSLNNKSLPRS